MAINLSIDGRRVEVEEGTTILEAARQAGIVIPSLCYHPYLTPVGSCRVCVVDIAGARELAASCTTPVAEKLSRYKPSEVGVVACARTTNEDNYVLQKFTRAVLHTNTIDCCARI